MQRAVAFLDDLPTVKIVGEIAYTELYSGGVCVSRTAVPIDQFIRNVAVCNEAIAEWESRQRVNNVVALPRPVFIPVHPEF